MLYHDDAELGEPRVETNPEIIQDPIVIMPPGKRHKEPSGSPPELALRLLLADPSHSLGLILRESILHLPIASLSTYRYFVRPSKK